MRIKTTEASADDFLAEASADLKDIAAEIARLQLQAAYVVVALGDTTKSGKVTRSIPREHIESHLAVHANMSKDTVRRLQRVARMIESHEERIRELGIGFETLAALADAPDPVREQALRLMERGQHISSADVAQLLQRAAHDETSAEGLAARERTAALETLATSVAAIKLSDFRKDIDRLLIVLETFVRSYYSPDPEDVAFAVDAPGYSEAHRKITGEASDIQRTMETVLGSDESFGAALEEHQWLETAYRALRRLSKGRFGHLGGFSLEESSTSRYSFDILDALEVLAPEQEGSSAYVSKSKRDLTVLEVCAGGGGMALGVMSAGFRHVSMLAETENEVATLRANWPAWNPHRQSISKLQTCALEAGHNVDLLVASPPCAPGEATARKKDLYPSLVKLVDQARPKTFVFANNSRQKKARSLSAQAEIVAMLEALEYRITELELHPAYYGLPQDERRSTRFTIGIRNDVIGVLPKPELKEPYREYVAGKLKEQMMPYRSAPAERSGVPLGTPQRRYDQWASEWMQRYRRSLLPGIPSGEDDREDHGGSWREAGFAGKTVVDDAPKVGDPTGDDYRPFITFKALAVAQGFTPSWEFVGDANPRLGMIAASIPPVMAKAVALSVRALLTGEHFDFDQEVRGEIVDDSRVGKNPSSLRPRRVMNPYYAKALRVAGGTPMKEAQPNHRRRKEVLALLPAAKEELARKRAEHEAQMEHEARAFSAWEDHVFPEGAGN